ncbi:MAG: chromosome segregation SMC family protein [Patescibacteria group bacterium]
MKLKQLELSGFKSFAKKTILVFPSPITAVVGPNGSGKSNITESLRWVMGEQSLKSLRGKKGEDLIFSGPQGRLSRASASLIFDNSDRSFSIDYDEIIITRTVFRDGSGGYAINGSPVRLKDVVALLAEVSLGSSGYHVISQGEADRILLARPVDRQAILEEALGLRLFRTQLGESEKKLNQTEDNINQVKSLKKEIAPHLRFLEKQVDKIRQAEDWRQELRQLYKVYLGGEREYIKSEKEKINQSQIIAKQKLEMIESELAQAEQKKSNNKIEEIKNKINDLENKRQTVLNRRSELERSLGRLEGEIAASQQTTHKESVVNQDQLKQYSFYLKQLGEELLATNNWEKVRQAGEKLLSWSQNLVGVSVETVSVAEIDNELEKRKIVIEQDLKQLANQLQELSQIGRDLDKERQSILSADNQKLSRYYELKADKRLVIENLNSCNSRAEQLKTTEEDLKRELAEGSLLVGRDIVNYYTDNQEVDFNKTRNEQQNCRRQIERLKLKLEAVGVDTAEVMSEYEETKTRNEFLTEELTDLEETATRLRILITDLETKIDKEFTEGLTKISAEFNRLLQLMFGGGRGTLKLQVVKEKEEFEAEEMVKGVEVEVNLPGKKVKGLEVLSGGERSLVSIALLFAMTRIKPPPFLVLDETDAALDEANSKRYGDLVEELSKQSQLILVTHNRETMSRADILYGVTINREGVSDILSVKFDQAESYAK